MLQEKKSTNLLGRFRDDKRGNIAIIFGFSIIPMVLIGGIAIDYTRDAMIHGRMSAAADAAALAATTPALLAQSSSAAQAAATSMFAAQVALVKGVTYDPGKLTINVVDSAGANGISRQVTVTYLATVTNFFGPLENAPQTSFTVTSVADISSAPNINFYLLLDSSPSMEIPATTAGINTMVKNTGCALACHETNFKDSEYTKHYSGWGNMDSYAYAENNGITLRVDNVRAAAQNLVSTSQSMMTSNKSVYQMSAHTFSDGVTKLLPLNQTTASNVPAMQSAIAAITPPLMSDNSYLAKGESYTYPTGANTYKTVTLSSNLYSNDTGTNFKNALSVMNSFMPAPGHGTTKTGDSPQGVLLIVTDGVDDVSLYNSSYCSTNQVWNFSNGYGSFSRCEQPVDTSLCDQIKARGIRIGVLYTTYYPLTSNSWYNNTVAPFISQVSSNLQSCASSSDLFFEVSTDGDITAAMKQLFINAVSSAPHLLR